MSALTEENILKRPAGSEVNEAVLSGSLGSLPEKESLVVRIFLSSTFTGKPSIQ